MSVASCGAVTLRNPGQGLSWSSKINFKSWSRRPISVDFPSSTDPHVIKRRRSLAWASSRAPTRRVHQKYPSRFFFSIDAISSLSIRRPLAFGDAARFVSATIASIRSTSDSNCPRQRITRVRKQNAAPIFSFSPGSNGSRSSSTMIQVSPRRTAPATLSGPVERHNETASTMT